MKCLVWSLVLASWVGKAAVEAYGYCSFDIDAIDPLYAPHTGTCVDGGLSRREANFITEELHASGRLRSLELVEVNPLKPSTSGDGPQKTIDLSLQIIGGALGRTIL